MTPSDKPKEAMINENSPICAMEKPQRTADFSDSPPNINAKVPKMLWPIRMVSTRAAMGRA